MATTFTLTRAELLGGLAHSPGVDPDPEVPEDDVAGTTFSVYPGFRPRVNGSPPAGEPITTAEIDENGALAFTGLTAGTHYQAYASRGGRDLHFYFTVDAA